MHLVRESLHASPQNNGARWNCSDVQPRANRAVRSANGADEKSPRRWYDEVVLSASHDGMRPVSSKKGDFQPYRFRYWLTEVTDSQHEQNGNCAQCSNENTGLRAIVSNIERKKFALNVRHHFHCPASFHATGHFAKEKR